MREFVLAWHPWIKAFHLIAAIAWMAGLLYLPRLFVYHCAAAPGSSQSETFKVMERRLLRAIMNPAMIAVWLFGGMLLLVQDWSRFWLHGKVALILLLTVAHHLMGRWRKDFEADRNARPARFYRIWNEVPTLAMIGIVVLAVVRPF